MNGSIRPPASRYTQLILLVLLLAGIACYATWRWYALRTERLRMEASVARIAH